MRKEFFCLKLNQRLAPETANFVVFVALAKDVDSWTGIRRVGEDTRGTQRLLKTTRVNAIKRFLAANPINTIPVSVILAFNPEIIEFADLTPQLTDALSGVDFMNGINGKGKWGKISFEFDPEGLIEDRPALIVDGQHRIKGMAKVEEDLPIVIAAFINAQPQEQAFQFVVINNKAQKVPTDNVKAIIRNINEDDLQMRLLKAGVSYGKYPATLGDIDDSEDSPFYKLLDWPLNQTNNKIVQLTTIETCLKYIKAILPILSEDDDSLKGLFIAIWKGVKGFYPSIWLTNEKFMSKVNIIALNEFIIDKLENAWLNDDFNIYEPSEVEGITNRFIEDIPVEFWTTEWTSPLQDNAVIRSRIKDDLRKITQNIRAGRDWDNSLKLIAEA